ncbi:MAG TPA: MFS transporter [Candidatus Limnocylindrales bacterium]|nr:MFS transporter [Candidatus Limnocylindrales bacterium]
MIALLRQRNFGLLWLAGLISMTGDWVLMVGLPVEVYRRTGSTLATAGMMLAWLVPAIVLGSIAGVFVDRWDRRRLMIVVNLLLAVTLLPLLAVDAAGIWVAYVVLVIASCLEQVFEPAEVALLPNLLEDEGQLVTANALSGMNRQLARIIGPTIGGITVAFGGLAAVTVVDAVSFVLAAGLILAIRTTRGRAAHADQPPASHDSVEHEAATAWTRLRREWAEGIRIVIGHPVLRALLAFVVITRIGEGLTGTLFVPWATDALHTDATGYGWLLSTQAIGGLVGAAVVGRVGKRIDPVRLLIASAVTFGLIDLVLFTYPAVYPVLAPALVLMVIVGVPGAAMGVAFTTIQQEQAADRIRGRVVGGLMALGAVGSLVGAIGAGVLGEVVPVIPLLIVQGSGYVIAGLAVWRLTARLRRPSTATEHG